MERSTRILLTCGLLAATAPLAAQRGPGAHHAQDGRAGAGAGVRADADARDAPGVAASPAVRTPSSARLTPGRPGDHQRRHATTASSRAGVLRPAAAEGARDRISAKTPGVVRTVGWIRVWAVDDDMSLATITHACDTIDIGDYLEPFALPRMPAVSTESCKPEKDNYGHVMMGDGSPPDLRQGRLLHPRPRQDRASRRAHGS